MSGLLIKLLRIRLPVPKRMFDFWVGLFADIVKAALLAVVPYLWFGEGSLAIRVFNGLCLCVIAYVAHLAYYSFVVREESLVIKKEEN